MSKKWTLFLPLGVIALAGLLFIGFTGPAIAKDKPLKIALILPGKIDDVSWNQAMYEGMKRVEKEMGDKIEVSYTEEVYEVADIEPALRDFASEGYDLIFGHGFQFMESIMKVAEQFPKVMFALGTGYKTLPNTCVYDIKLEEGGYLMGILAGMMTRTYKIGGVGGCDVSECYRGHEAYKFAAKKVNPEVEIQEVYTGDWTDAVKAKEASIAMYDSGVDIIWNSGDGIGLGGVAAAKEKGKWILTCISDQHVLAPKAILSGIVYDWAPLIKEIINDVLKGNFTNRTKKFYWLTVKNGGIKVLPFYQHASQVPPRVKEVLTRTEKGLADGSLKIPHFER